MKQLLLALALWPLAARAHDPGLSSATVDLGSGEILVQVSFAPADLRPLQTSIGGNLAARSVEFRAQDIAVQATSEETREIGADNVEFTLRFPRPASAAVLRSPLLSHLPRGHRQVVTVRNAAGETLLTELLSADRDSISLPSGMPEGSFPFEPPRSFGRHPAPVVATAALALGALWLLRRRRTVARERAQQKTD